ncbi:hypothetical protein PROFUN_14733 [Planoprotostelium fungivorum]|uniref:Uncharacterized protein n=1 Tax=Planoprotostelium fungivorum TaxID=1890364 RepID=A0A2P6N255_9EUKA|nr:hypothetical protein PROFUN_14733 [Planoprotostelium fungivorum]
MEELSTLARRTREIHKKISDRKMTMMRSNTLHDLRTVATATHVTPLGGVGSGRHQKKSTLMQLDEALLSKLADKEFERKLARYEEVRNAIGRISFGIQLERSGATPLATIEEAYAKASHSLTTAINHQEVLRDEDLVTVLRVFHIQKKKPPAHYDKLELENQELKDEVDRLKKIIEDLEVEVQAYKVASSNNNRPIIESPTVIRTRAMNEVPKFITDLDVQTGRIVEEQAASFLAKLDRTRQSILELKKSDERIVEKLTRMSLGATRNLRTGHSGLFVRSELELGMSAK